MSSRRQRLPGKLEKLWSLTDRLAEPLAVHPDAVFGDCGLFLQRPLKNHGYFCTPKNSLTFASTGGDGVHYGFLEIPDAEPLHGPIVMTVPMGWEPYNVILGADLEEFLGIGHANGWFSLEQIMYDADEALRFYSEPDPDSWPERESLMEVLRTELEIQPVSLDLSRLKQLEREFMRHLMLHDDVS